MRSNARYTIKQLDSSSSAIKIALRRRVLRELGRTPFVLETHCGWGSIWSQLYQPFDGVALDSSEERVIANARLRPHWACYQVKSEDAIARGILAPFVFDYIDLDPYGSPFETIAAIFKAPQQRWPRRLDIVAFDGSGYHVRFTGAWQLKTMQPYVQKYGAARMYEHYLDVCRDFITDHSRPNEYSLMSFKGLRSGRDLSLTHFHAALTRPGD